MNLLTLLVLVNLQCTFPPDSLGGVFQGDLLVTVEDQFPAPPYLPIETWVPGPHTTGDLILFDATIPPDGLPHKIWVQAHNVSKLSPRKNLALAMAWTGAPDTLIYSALGRDRWTGEEWKYSEGQKVVFIYKKDLPTDASLGSPAWLMNVDQLANWPPVRADLCRLYHGYARGGELVPCDWMMIRGEVKWR